MNEICSHFIFEFPRFLDRQSVQLVDQRLRNRNKKALQISEALFLFSSFNWNFYKNKQKEPQLKNTECFFG